MAPALRALATSKTTPQIIARAYSVKNGDAKSTDSDQNARNRYCELMTQQCFLEQCKDDLMAKGIRDDGDLRIKMKLDKDIEVVQEERKKTAAQISEPGKQQWLQQIVEQEEKMVFLKERIKLRIAKNNCGDEEGRALINQFITCKTQLDRLQIFLKN